MKTVDFSETIAASDLKVSRSSHLIEYILNAKSLALPFLSIFSGSKSMTSKINVI